MNILLHFQTISAILFTYSYFQASDQEDDFVTKINSQKQLHLPPTESVLDSENEAGGEKIKSVNKSKLLVQNLLSDGLCKASKLTDFLCYLNLYIFVPEFLLLTCIFHCICFSFDTTYMDTVQCNSLRQNIYFSYITVKK